MNDAPLPILRKLVEMTLLSISTLTSLFHRSISLSLFLFCSCFLHLPSTACSQIFRSFRSHQMPVSNLVEKVVSGRYKAFLLLIEVIHQTYISASRQAVSVIAKPKTRQDTYFSLFFKSDYSLLRSVLESTASSFSLMLQISFSALQEQRFSNHKSRPKCRPQKPHEWISSKVVMIGRLRGCRAHEF